ncbi:translation initiation factor Sui1 [candidate division MSBL1 archaeon SCGC-AAA261F19]|uniref:Protein translation factor SUI1 homolog n=4 Tax=candidate division MSBL1 TaxID=215777 RepID=A0A133VSF4_9EURY|nr:translation initiation factor Sui1 [candidate division MSBL1 archaeon SCGC-AAA261F19]KXB02555.1 translation initiation factor Sui1 [candidate division MSBL1 archaeon SCGC-AAA261D19]KXB04204.1 translation initiation factor Sui1 [candidate division MSBL1 archaeon SCGC-AAA261G05]KXB09363.1 translation initiation factor Sui1 [candidate division MSBL1 archaeon SCGC-AAA833K04]|eukprot:TRINITY_DN35404_c0_g1_i1.p1 TRINITY_DN35404_c0_g1~~TRINITY_DN35404_c0_g1_i1.p1  ORF type:complete len:103 (-),score=4.25 TRINITY_DN35404_c0_g1_i1:104-412(-)
MPEICPTCGLPKEICTCEEIAREQQRIGIYSAKRKFGKIVTIIEGINEKQVDLEDLAKKLKTNLACGGTVKNGRIELQGNHKSRVREMLTDMGFSPNMIDLR